MISRDDRRITRTGGILGTSFLVCMFAICIRSSFSSSSSSSRWIASLSSMLLSSSSSSSSIPPIHNGISFPRLPIDSLSLSSSSSLRFVHLIVLVHGWMGSPLELDHLKQTLLSMSKQRPPHHFVLVHAAQSNHGKTMDGIAMGGHRLAKEINAWIRILRNQVETETTTPKTRISISIVGNSLGGLYARYALSEIPIRKFNTNHGILPALFITTATPHLGVAAPHTYMALPAWFESTVASIMGTTGWDLFRHTTKQQQQRDEVAVVDTIQQMTVDPKFTKPLRQFRYRIAYANAHYTDFQVPCSTAAFLSKNNNNHNTDSMHHHYYPYPIEKQKYVTLAVTTTTTTTTHHDDKQDANNEDTECMDKTLKLSSDELARRMDRMGWIKIFCDVRETLPQLTFPTWRKSSNSDVHSTTSTTNDTKYDKNPNSYTKTKNSYTSSELWELYAKFNRSRIHLPLGHTMLVANAKNEFYRKFNSPGQPIMEDLANWMLQHLYQLRSEETDDVAAGAMNEHAKKGTSFTTTTTTEK